MKIIPFPSLQPITIKKNKYLQVLLALTSQSTSSIGGPEEQVQGHSQSPASWEISLGGTAFIYSFIYSSSKHFLIVYICRVLGIGVNKALVLLVF